MLRQKDFHSIANAHHLIHSFYLYPVNICALTPSISRVFKFFIESFVANYQLIT